MMAGFLLLAASLAAMALPAFSFQMPGASPASLGARRGPASCTMRPSTALRAGFRRPLALAMQEAAAAPVFAGDLKKALSDALASESAAPIAAAFEKLKKEGALSKWNSQTGMKSRAVAQNEVPGVGLRIAVPSSMVSARRKTQKRQYLQLRAAI